MKGLSILELAIVMAVIAIVIIVSIPLITNIAQNRQLIAARKIQADLRWAQQFAVNRNSRTRIVFSAGTSTYTVYEKSTGTFQIATDPATRSSFIVKLNTGEYAGVVINSVSFDGGNTLEFDSLGKPYAGSSVLVSTGVISLPNSISVNVIPETGKVKVSP